MQRYDSATYGERVADLYDEIYTSYDEAAITLLAELAQGGSALELGIGTGRIALPLAARGVAVSGVDASAAMVERLKAKPGGDAVPVTLGDFKEVGVGGSFALVYIVFNTFWALLTQGEQVACFENVAARLAPEGVFLIETVVPDPTRFHQGQTVRAARVNEHQVTLECTRHDPVLQRVTSQNVILSDSGVRLCPVQLRYVWPSELDLMARIAGLTLRHRWGGWYKEPFTAASTRQVSVYERRAGGR